MDRYRKHTLHAAHETAGLRQPISNQKKFSTFIVILILTGPRNQEQRESIRETWLSNIPMDVTSLFVIGTKGLSIEETAALVVENSTTGDLLLLPDLKDSYGALTTKILQTFMWLDQHVDFKFVFKGDDDTYARVDVIVEELRARKASKFYWGFFDGRAKVKKSGQWAEKNWFLCDTYVPHALGGGYVLSSDLVCYIAENGNRFTKFNSEDVSVGTWLAPLDITRLHDVRFDTEYKSRGCFNKYIVTHKQSPADIRNKHMNLQETGKLCASEFRVRNSYIYNWDVKASECCIRDDDSIP